MPLIKKLKYRLPKEEEPKPEYILKVLKDVQTSINSNIPYPIKTLTRILDIIEPGIYTVLEKTGSLEMDFRAVRKLIEDYKLQSTPGCRSCTHVGKTLEMTFCSLKESEKTARRSGNLYEYGSSPTVDQHLFKPCEDWQEKYPTIEKIIENS
ncbi:MAG: hypothetical protein ABIH25_03900 [Candidatus Woesearchaeota archaeon]